MARVVRAFVLSALAVMLPAGAWAQGVSASITGTVKDTSGAVLPGVTVEVASPVLIEKTRSAVTDGSGQYRIVDLRPGTYSVTFTLTGFSSVKREGIELSGSFTATVNGDMKVGAVEETITVSGETPIVDVQSTRRQTTLSGETINAIPTTKSWAAIMVLMPSTITQAGTSADVQVTPGMVVFGGAGGRNNEGRLLVDGLNTGVSRNGAGVSGYNADLTNASEVVTTNSGGLGEIEVNGPVISVVPKTGGNVFKGTLLGSYVGSGTANSNYSDELKAAGLASPLQLLKVWDATAGVGGPIKKDRVWFFFNYRDEGSWATIPGIFANKNFENITTPVPNSAAPWTVVPDTSVPARNANSWQIMSMRVTTQINSRNKLNLFWDEQHPCNGATWTAQGEGCRKPSNNEVFESVFGSPNTSSPEAGGYSHRFQRVQQATWSSPMTNKLLLEAGVGTYLSRWGTNRRPDSVTADLVRVTEGCSIAGCAANGGVPGLNYRSEAPFDDWIGAHTWRASASYVTGAHSMKFGYSGAWHEDQQKNFPNSTFTQYQLQNGSASCAAPTNNGTSCPGVLIAESLSPYQVLQDVRFDAFYGQEQYTTGRFTFQAAVRFDHAWSYFPDETVGPVRFLTTPVTFAQNDPLYSTPSTLLCSGDLKGSNLPAGFSKTCINNITGYKDITTRWGMAWDVKGDGKTSVKVSFGKYLEAASSGNGNYTAGNPVARMPTNMALGVAGPAAITRSWSDTNKNFTPDCVLENPLANGECGNLSNTSFGKPVFTNSFNSDLMGGWGIRPSDWGFVASIQQQVLPRTSVEVSYTRRWLNGFTVTDNLSTVVGDYRPFSVTAPTDGRLGDASGQKITGLFNPTQAAAVLAPNNFNEPAADIGNQYQHFNGFLVNISSRVRGGLTLQGGINSGKTVSDNCEIRSAIPELTVAGIVSAAGPGVNASNPWCHIDSGFVTRGTALASYLVPKVDVLFATTFRSDQGGPLAANYTIPLAVAQAGGLAGAYANGVSPIVNLVQPGTLYGDRVNELDFKIAKVLRFGTTRTNVGIEIFNALNSAAVLTYNQVFNPAVQGGPGAWLQPTQVLTARFFKFSATFDF